MRTAHNKIPIEQLIGQRFHRLIILQEVKQISSSKNIKIRRMLCKCDCGKEVEVCLSSLRSGKLFSCGCYQKDFNPNFKHGFSGGKHPLYSTWLGMKQRCTNPKATDYNHYGGRGIKVCERWTNNDGFQNFIKDMGERPKGTTIDRIDNDGNYEPINCKWATVLEQRINQRPRKLTKTDILDIQNAWLLNCFTKTEISRAYGVSFTVISDIVNGERN